MNKHWEIIIYPNDNSDEERSREPFYGTEKEAYAKAEEMAGEHDFYVLDKSPRWDSSSIRLFCIAGNYYTCGSNEQYAEMMKFVDSHEPTAHNVELVAIDIISHSTRYSIFNDGDVDYMSNEIWNKVVTC